MESELEAVKKENGKLQSEVAVLRKENVELKRALEDLKRQLSFDDTTPQYLTEGSFGKISHLPLQNYVYKSTILRDRANGKKLEHEFNL